MATIRLPKHLISLPMTLIVFCLRIRPHVNAFSTISLREHICQEKRWKRDLSYKKIFQGFNGRIMNLNLSSSTQDSNEDYEDDMTWEPFKNKSNIRDQVLSCISANGEMKITATSCRNVVNELMIQHTLTSVSADALGRAVACALLLSNGMKDQQTFQLTVNGDGPIRGIFAISNGLGHVRGYVGAPDESS